MVNVRTSSPLQIYRRALKEARAFWPHLAVILLLGLLETPLGLLTPLPMKVIIDSVIGDAAPPAWLDPSFYHLPAAALLPLAIALSLGLAVLALANGLGSWLFRESVADGL